MSNDTIALLDGSTTQCLVCGGEMELVRVADLTFRWVCPECGEGGRG